MERMSDILAKTISQRARAQRTEQAARRTPPAGSSSGDGQDTDQTPQTTAPQRPVPIGGRVPTPARPATPSVSTTRVRTPGASNSATSGSRVPGAASPAPASSPAPLAARPARAVQPAPRTTPGRVLHRPTAQPAQDQGRNAGQQSVATPNQMLSQKPSQGQPVSRAPIRLAADAREMPNQPPRADTETADVADRVLELPPRRTAATRARTTTPLAAPDAGIARRSGQPAAFARQQEGDEPAVEPSRPTTRLGAPTRLGRATAAHTTDALPGGMTSLREVASDYQARLARATSRATTRTTRQQAPASVGPENGIGNDLGDEEIAEGTLALSPAERLDSSAPDVCPICHGAGYVRIDVPLGDPSFGQPIPCECKKHADEERRRSELNQLSSLAPFRNKTFETFDTRVPGLAEAFEVARRYAAAGEGWLVLAGGYGTGKTHLAAAIANDTLARGTPVFFSVVPDLLDHLRAAFAPNSEMTYDTLFDRIREVELLVLDDLGAENSTAWATEKLFQLLNYRYNQRMPTVFTTNRRLLDHLDERIRSRLSDLSLVRHVVIEAADFRERHAGRPQRASRTTGGNSGNGGSLGRGGSGGNLPPRGRGYWQ